MPAISIVILVSVFLVISKLSILTSNCMCELATFYPSHFFYLSIILLAATKPGSDAVHLKRGCISFSQSVVCSTNHNPACRTRASPHGLTAPTNGVDMSLGAFVPAALRQVHRRHDLLLFFRCYWRKLAVGLPGKITNNDYVKLTLGGPSRFL